MQKKLSGIIKSISEFDHQSGLVSGLILIPEIDWCETIIVGQDVKLILVGGEEYQTKVRGFTLREKPAGVLVNKIPNIANEYLVGAKLYVFSK